MEILGIKINNLTMTEAVLEVSQRIKEGKKFWIATPNPEMIVKAYDEPFFKETLNKANILVPDGVGLIWLSRLKNGDLKERVAGSDLAEKLCAQASKEGWKVFFLGGRGDTAHEAMEALKTKYKGLEGEAYEGPEMEIKKYEVGSGKLDNENEKWELVFKDNEKQKQAIERINKYQPDILFVAFGQGKQERWIVENLPSLKVKGAMVVGGSFDFYAGKILRAPKIFQNLGLEWFWRLILEPWRWKRQLALVKFMYYGLRNN